MSLELIGIDHRYGRRQSLFGLSIHVHPGDCYGFLGHNGAGKTTAMRVALGLDRARSGTIRVDGFDAVAHPKEARARMSGVIEVMGFYPWMSGRDNLTALGRLGGLSRKDARAAADEWLVAVGLEDAAGRKVGGYSQGMRQRLGLAQALLGYPKYVLLDEPQNGLDPEGIALLRGVLQRLTREHRMTVLLSSHQLHEVTGLCNRIGVLREGRLLVEEETDKLLATARRRYDVVTDDLERTDAVLDDLGLAHSETETGARRVELEELPAQELNRRLVDAGVGVEELTPRGGSLEEVYLELTHSESEPAVATTTTTSVPTTTPEKLAPRFAWLRVLLFELRRSARWPMIAMLAVPAILAWRRISVLASNHARHLAEVAHGQLFSTSGVTAYEAAARGCKAAVPALAFLIAAIASQSVSSELSLGTLRNVLLRPVRRFDVSVGKWLSLAIGLSLAFLAVLVVSLLTASAHFDFGDRFEIYRDAQPELMIEAVDVSPDFVSSLLSPLVPLLAYASLGFLVGALLRRSTWALGLALTLTLVLDLGRAIAHPLGLEAALPSAYLSSPFRDTSQLAFFLDLSIGSAEAYFEFEHTAWITAVAWCVIPFALATLLIARKRVP